MADVSQTAKLAVLIDADNAQPALAEPLLAEIAKYGVASVRRIYGDWMTNNLAGWKKVLLEHAIQPIQQVRYTTGKNATDSAMIIDAMDLLYTQRFDGFCIVSSDSDFTRLAVRIREAGLTAYGFGERKTPTSFVAACDKFIYVDVLRVTSAVPEEAEPTLPKDQAQHLRNDVKLLNLIRNAIDAGSEDDGWAHLGTVGQHISKQVPDFDARNWGYRKLSDLVKAIGAFEVRESTQAGSNSRVLELRERRKTKSG